MAISPNQQGIVSFSTRQRVDMIQNTIYNISAMLPKREVLTRLIRSNTSFILYGQKACGKTTLVHSLLEETNSNYLEINCTLANKRSNFLKLFNVQMYKYLRSKGLQLQISSASPVNLDTWINDVKKIIKDSPDAANQALENLYIFMDNIQEMTISQNFLPSFYAACQKQFDFKFSFIFCGVNFLKKEYCLELPFRTMISFCMPKPEKEFQITIARTVQSSLQLAYKEKISHEQLEKCTSLLTKQIKAAFENIDFNLERMKTITRSIVDLVTTNILSEDKQFALSLKRAINRDELAPILTSVKEQGPMMDNLMKRKYNATDAEEKEILDVNHNLQYYPSLILTSIHLADYYNEKEDKRRFKDYKSKTSGRNRDIKRSDFKIGRHNVHRIIAIADSLESQATKENDKEQKLEHHSLDFYSQFQHLRRINRIKYTGAKLTGVVKEDEAKAFLTSKLDLRYDQFMS